MMLRWMITLNYLVDPTKNHKCPNKREAKEELTKRQEAMLELLGEKSEDVTLLPLKTEEGAMSQEPRSCPNSWKRQGSASDLEPLEGVQPC